MRTLISVTRSDVELRPDARRVLTLPFVPGRELQLDQESRAGSVLDRLLALSDADVDATLPDVLTRFGDRHRDLPSTLQADFDLIAHRIPQGTVISPARRQLLGAFFTHEFSIEGAALFNPSVVAHPDQSGVADGACRFVMSLRAVGEGHLSCIELRTGTVDSDGSVTIDDPGRWVEAGNALPTTLDRDLFAAKLKDLGPNPESTRFLLAALPTHFDEVELERALASLEGQRATRRGGYRLAELARRIAQSFYEIDFPPETAIAERVLWPRGPEETRGMEDARFVRFTDDDGSVSYRATYTAFDGSSVAPQAIETADFQRFRISPLAGPAARNKGLALFPRKVDGRLLALSRWDRESNYLATSSNGRSWDDAGPLQQPHHTWDLMQSGNCGSPLETAAGWLVLTHGVGAMREYAIGALLLDLDDPRRVIGELREPLLHPRDDEREGYVPNVVYSCGALINGDTMLLPYGASDDRIRFCTVDVPSLLAQLS